MLIQLSSILIHLGE
uniref:Uncharacterized protein n=1 Tax=Arundo donax TaxID=35708 RepID=A0A0A9BKN9_ARUDO